MSRDALLAAWERQVDWIGNVLTKDGVEGCVLQPVGQMPAAATALVRHAFQSDNYIHRKVGAALGGYVTDADHHLLKELFEGERTRDAKMPADSRERLFCQSVVEDIVFAAARWCRSDDLRTAGLDLSSDVVRRTIDGEYWNTASYAMTTLCFYREAGAAELLKRFHAFCTPSGLPFRRKPRLPEHPSRPTLEQERQFAQGLAAGNPATLRSIERLLDQKDDGARQVALSADARQWLNGLLDLARTEDA